MVTKEQLSAGSRQEDKIPDRRLRPAMLDEYIGQPAVKRQLRVFIAAAKKRDEALDHTLLFGPPGLGKTTLAMIISTETGGNLHTTSGPALERAGDIAALMTALSPGDVLFIDEIHRLHPAIEETMYSALEDFRLDIIIGEGQTARSVKLDLPPFTLIAPLPAPVGLPRRCVIVLVLFATWNTTMTKKCTPLFAAVPIF